MLVLLLALVWDKRTVMFQLPTFWLLLHMLRIRALLFGIQIKAPDFGKRPGGHEVPEAAHP